MTLMPGTDSLKMRALSVVLIEPQSERRLDMAKAMAGPQAVIAREISRYPEVDEWADLTQADYDVVVVDLDANPEQALDVVENL